MNKEEMLDKLALSAMQKMLERTDIPLSRVAYGSYSLALAMLEEKQKVLSEWEQAEQKMSSDLSLLDLDCRTLNCLKAEDIYNLTQLTKWTERNLLKVPNLGRKSVLRLKEKLELHGLKLAE